MWKIWMKRLTAPRVVGVKIRRKEEEVIKFHCCKIVEFDADLESSKG
jgi:hypothetical protein